MKYTLLFILCYTFIPQTVTEKKPSQMTNLELEGILGKVKTIRTQATNTATLKNGKWIIKDTNAVYSIASYNMEGNDVHLIYRLKMLTRRTIASWIDDGVGKSLWVEAGYEDAPELSSFHFINDSTLLCKTFIVDKDTMIQKLTEESITVYTSNGRNTTNYTIDETGKTQDYYSIQINKGNDTFYYYHCEEDTSLLTTINLEKDQVGNPTKILAYKKTDTFITLKEYTYYD